MDENLRRVIRSYLLRRYGQQNRPGRFVVEFDANCHVIDERIEAVPLALLRDYSVDDDEDSPVGPVGSDRHKSGPRHSPDFASVFDGQTQYTFNGSQRAVIKLLWEGRENDTPSLSKEYLLEESGSTSDRLRDIFRDHPAWGKLIVAGNGGTYRLQFPGDPLDHAEAG